MRWHSKRSERLDTELARHLGNRPLDLISYGEAFRACGQRDEREQQLRCVNQIGSALDRTTRWPLIGTTLKLMRAPARAAGLEKLQEFLEGGYAAFKQMRGADEFLATIAKRETAISRAPVCKASAAIRSGGNSMSTAPAKKIKSRLAAKTPARPAARKKPAAKAAKKMKPATKRPAATKAPAAVSEKPARSASPAPVSPGIVAALAGISTAAVAKATGHGWNYWLRALDKAGAAKLPHKEIVNVLHDKLGLRKSWWVQMVTVGYEQARGLRKLNQKTDGFVATVSRTVAVPISALFAAWEEGRRGDWLPDAIEVRRATKNKSMRITWPDGSGVDVNFYDKGGSKAVVAIEQSKLPDEGAVAAVKQLWNSTLDRLKSTLEGKG